MKEILSTITSRGQITIPAEVRKLLGTKNGDKIAFEIEDGQVRLRAARFTLKSAFGSVTPKHRPEDFDAMIDDAMEEQADHIVRSLRRR